jgi:hypothetical protein
MMIIPRALLLSAVLGWCAPVLAEELDVLTLRNGRHLEGHYDDLTHTLTFGGGLTGGVQVEPGDIVKRDKLVVADVVAGTGAPAAEAPAARSPAAANDPGSRPAPTASATKDAARDPILAKRMAGVRAVKKSQLKRDLQSSVDYQKLYETNIQKMQAEQTDLPSRIQQLDARISAARGDYNSAQSRYTNVQSEYDYWYSYRYRSSTYNGASVADARHQRDKAEANLKKLESEQETMRKRQSRLVNDLPSEQAKLRSSIEKQGKIAADLQALELEEATAGSP